MKQLSKLKRLVAALAVVVCAACGEASGSAEPESARNSTAATARSVDSTTVAPLPSPLGTTVANSSVSVALDGSSILIANKGDEPVYFAAYPLEMLDLIFWTPCSEPASCRDALVKPGQIRRVSLRSVARPATQTVVVFIWSIQTRPDGTGTYATEPSRVNLALP